MQRRQCPRGGELGRGEEARLSLGDVPLGMSWARAPLERQELVEEQVSAAVRLALQYSSWAGCWSRVGTVGCPDSHGALGQVFLRTMVCLQPLVNLLQPGRRLLLSPSPSGKSLPPLQCEAHLVCTLPCTDSWASSNRK